MIENKQFLSADSGTKSDNNPTAEQECRQNVARKFQPHGCICVACENAWRDSIRLDWIADGVGKHGRSLLKVPGGYAIRDDLGLLVKGSTVRKTIDAAMDAEAAQ